ncbi:hypothetical protein [Streptomyces chartreusis]
MVHELDSALTAERHSPVTAQTHCSHTQDDVPSGRTTRIRTAIAAAAVLSAALAGCTSTDDISNSSKAQTSTPPELTDEQRAGIREAAGLPSTPNLQDWAAYIKALNSLDADIVHGKEDKAVSRGIDTCSAVKRDPGNTAKQATAVGQRLTSPTHPEGCDQATAEKILNAVHKHICPTY